MAQEEDKRRSGARKALWVGFGLSAAIGMGGMVHAISSGQVAGMALWGMLAMVGLGGLAYLKLAALMS